MKRPLGTSARRMDTAPLVLIDVDTEEAVSGRAYVFCYLPAATAAVEAILSEAAACVTGDRIAPVDLNAKLARHFRLLGVHGLVTMALAGFDAACWDALAVAAGRPARRVSRRQHPARAGVQQQWVESNGDGIRIGIRDPGSGIRDQGLEIRGRD
jgi:mandelate racemase